jgi:hypothetical protein
MLRGPLIGLGLIIVCYLPALILTYLLFPLWTWVEATYGIESVGHASVADWCFYATYTAVYVLSVMAVVYTIKRPSSSRR